MATTALSDVYNQPALASYMIQDPVEKTAFFQSGVLATNGIISELARSPSNEIVIPFWNPIDASVEPNYSNDVYTDIAVPRAVNTGTQRARIAYLNEGFSSADLVAELTKQDPLRYVAARLDNFWQRQAQRRVIATAVGIYNDNVAGNGGDMVKNVALTSGTPGEANMFSAGAFIDAQATMGDTLDGLGAVAMHRAVYTHLQKQNLIDFVPDSDQKTQIPTYQGLRIVVDNGMPKFGSGATTQYLCIIFGAGAIGYGDGQPKNALAFEREESRANGGGVETLWTRKDMILHPFGYKFLSTTITGNGTETRPASASWADLALATNWERVVPREAVPMAFLVVNA